MTRLKVGARVVMNPAHVDREVFADPDYRGVGELRCDDRTSLPFHVYFPETGKYRWFTPSELMEAETGKFRLLLAMSPMDGDGDVRGVCFVTNEAVNPFDIPMGIEGRKSTCGYTRISRALVRDEGSDQLDSNAFRHVYALIDGVVMKVEQPKFGERQVNTPQLEIGAVYKIESGVCTHFPNGTFVTLEAQEPESLKGLSYKVRKVNSTDWDWISNRSVLVKV